MKANNTKYITKKKYYIQMDSVGILSKVYNKNVWEIN
jgi:hypothetical protein